MIETMVIMLAVAQYNPAGDANCVAWYRFEDSAITTDSSGNSLTLTNVSATPVSTTVYKEGAGAAQLDGSADYLYLDSADFPVDWPFASGGPTDMTICFWVRPRATYNSNPNDPTGWAPFVSTWHDFSNYPGATDTSWTIGTWGAGWGVAPDAIMTYGTRYTPTGISEVDVNIAESRVVTDRWYHIAMVLSDANDQRDLYFYDDNGSTLYSESRTFGSSNPLVATTFPFYVGAGDTMDAGDLTAYQGDGVLEKAHIFIDDLIIFNRPLTEAEIVQVYSQTFTGVGGGAAASTSKQVMRIGME